MNFEQWYENNLYGASADIPVFKEYARSAYKAGYNEGVSKRSFWSKLFAEKTPVAPAEHKHIWDKWKYPGAYMNTQFRLCKECGYREEVKVEHYMYIPKE